VPLATPQQARHLHRPCSTHGAAGNSTRGPALASPLHARCHWQFGACIASASRRQPSNHLGDMRRVAKTPSTAYDWTATTSPPLKVLIAFALEQVPVCRTNRKPGPRPPRTPAAVGAPGGRLGRQPFHRAA
jgi:hypothetical protein